MNFSTPYPWRALAPATIRFCEDATAGWVVEPANTWSNIGFIIVAFLIFKKARTSGDRHLGWLGWAALATGIGSAIFHGTQSFIGEVLDYGAMFLGSGLVILFALGRNQITSARRLGGIFFIILAGSLFILIELRKVGIHLFAIQMLVWGALEWRAVKKSSGSRIEVRALRILGLAFVTAYSIWWLDKLGIVCDPDRHWLSGHGIWHLLGASWFYLFYMYYEQFDLLRTTFGIEPRQTHRSLDLNH